MDHRPFPDGSTLVAALILAVLPILVPITLAIQIAVFATGALSVTFLLGGSGLLSFGQGLFFGVGAYVTGLALRDGGLGLLPSLAASSVAGAVLAGLLGSVIVRRYGVYFVMLTLAFAQMGYFAMLAFKSVTGGENGLTGVPRTLSFAGLPVATPAALYGLTAVAFLLVLLGVQRVLASPFGSVLTAIRENETRSEALGYPVARYKTAAFALAGGIAGLAGGLHVAFLGFVPPSDIELETSQRLLVMGIVGGVASPGGALAGAAFYTIVAELLSAVWPRWLALVALLLIAIVLFLPGGLWSIGTRLSGWIDRRRPARG